MPKRRVYTPFEEGVVKHFVKEPKPAAPKTSWWTEPTTFSDFSSAAKERDQAMGWSSKGSGGRELKTMYEDWRLIR